MGLAIGCAAEDRPSRLRAAPDDGHRHGEAEQVQNREIAALATGSLTEAGIIPRKPWPTQVLSIGHTHVSYQSYGGSPYFHHGLDIRADAGTDVLAAAGGKVVNIENYVPGDDAYWEVAILDAHGFLWQYHHVERDSIPQAIFDAKASGALIPDGTKIGEVFYWSVTTFGERYHHIHLNVLGEGSRYQNPFDFLEPLADTKAPVFVEVGIVKNGARHTGRTVNGQYSLFAQVHDLILHDRFVVPPQSIAYKLDGADPVTVWDFSELPGGSSNTTFVNDYFVRSLTCGNYDCRKLTVNLGFTKTGTRWFTTTRGAHSVELIAKDYAGNETRQSFSWQVE